MNLVQDSHRTPKTKGALDETHFAPPGQRQEHPRDRGRMLLLELCGAGHPGQGGGERRRLGRRCSGLSHYHL